MQMLQVLSAAEGSFRRMIIISPSLCNNFLEAFILSFINSFMHSRNIYTVLSIILYRRALYMRSTKDPWINLGSWCVMQGGFLP